MSNFIIKDNLRLNKEDLLYLLIITVTTALLAYFLISLYNKTGTYSPDVFSYLNNALVLSGNHVNKGKFLYLSPIISFLTSLLFRLGMVNETAIYLVTGLFGYLGFIRMYLLLKTRFTRILSLMGTILYMSFSLNILGLANGMLDLPAAAVSIWIILFMIISSEIDSKYYILIFPLIVIGFLTRYTCVLIIPTIFLYYFLRKDILSNIKSYFDEKSFKTNTVRYLKSKEFLYISIGLIFTLIILFGTLNFLEDNGAKFTFLTQASEVSNNSLGDTTDINFNNDVNFYLKHFPTSLFSNSNFTTFIEYRNLSYLAYIILTIIFLIIPIKLYDLFKSRKLLKNSIKNKIKIKENSKINYYNISLIIIFLILILSLLIGTNLFSPIQKIVLTFISLLLIGTILKTFLKNELGEKFNIDLTISLISLFLVYMIFFSYLNIKVDRYIIPVLITVSYLFLYSIHLIQLKLDSLNIELLKSMNKIIPILVIIVLLVSTINFIETAHKESYIENFEEVRDYLSINVPDYQECKYATNHKARIFSWVLKAKIKLIHPNETDKLNSYKFDYYIYNKKVDQDKRLNEKEYKL